MIDEVVYIQCDLSWAPWGCSAAGRPGWASPQDWCAHSLAWLPPDPVGLSITPGGYPSPT